MSIYEQLYESIFPFQNADRSKLRAKRPQKGKNIARLTKTILSSKDEINKYKRDELHLEDLETPSDSPNSSSNFDILSPTSENSDSSVFSEPFKLVDEKSFQNLVAQDQTYSNTSFLNIDQGQQITNGQYSNHVISCIPTTKWPYGERLASIEEESNSATLNNSEEEVEEDTVSYQSLNFKNLENNLAAACKINREGNNIGSKTESRESLQSVSHCESPNADVLRSTENEKSIEALTAKNTEQNSKLCETYVDETTDGTHETSDRDYSGQSKSTQSISATSANSGEESQVHLSHSETTKVSSSNIENIGHKTQAKLTIDEAIPQSEKTREIQPSTSNNSVIIDVSVKENHISSESLEEKDDDDSSSIFDEFIDKSTKMRIISLTKKLKYSDTSNDEIKMQNRKLVSNKTYSLLYTFLF